METLKVILKHKTTKEEFEKIIKGISPEAVIYHYYEELQVGCNTISQAIIDVPDTINYESIKSDRILRFEKMTTYQTRGKE